MQTLRDGFYHYARKERLRDYLDLGWIAVADLGEWSVLVFWMCDCPWRLPRGD